MSAAGEQNIAHGPHAPDLRISVDPSLHEQYGLAYPITYIARFSTEDIGLRAFVRYDTVSAWTALPEKFATDLFNGMKRIGIPIELIDLMMIIYRYIFIVYAQAFEIWQAQVMRLGYNRPREAIRSFSMLCGMLFINSWNAGEDLIRAMDCRCYDGVFPALDIAEPVQVRSLLPVLLYLCGLTGILLLMTTRGVL